MAAEELDCTSLTHAQLQAFERAYRDLAVLLGQETRVWGSGRRSGALPSESSESRGGALPQNIVWLAKEARRMVAGDGPRALECLWGDEGLSCFLQAVTLVRRASGNECSRQLHTYTVQVVANVIGDNPLCARRCWGDRNLLLALSEAWDAGSRNCRSAVLICLRALTAALSPTQTAVEDGDSPQVPVRAADLSLMRFPLGSAMMKEIAAQASAFLGSKEDDSCFMSALVLENLFCRGGEALFNGWKRILPGARPSADEPLLGGAVGASPLDPSSAGDAACEINAAQLLPGAGAAAAADANSDPRAHSSIPSATAAAGDFQFILSNERYYSSLFVEMSPADMEETFLFEESTLEFLLVVAEAGSSFGRATIKFLVKRLSTLTGMNYSKLRFPSEIGIPFLSPEEAAPMRAALTSLSSFSPSGVVSPGRDTLDETHTVSGASAGVSTLMERGCHDSARSEARDAVEDAAEAARAITASRAAGPAVRGAAVPDISTDSPVDPSNVADRLEAEIKTAIAEIPVDTHEESVEGAERGVRKGTGRPAGIGSQCAPKKTAEPAEPESLFLDATARNSALAIREAIVQDVGALASPYQSPDFDAVLLLTQVLSKACKSLSQVLDRKMAVEEGLLGSAVCLLARALKLQPGTDGRFGYTSIRRVGSGEPENEPSLTKGTTSNLGCEPEAAPARFSDGSVPVPRKKALPAAAHGEFAPGYRAHLLSIIARLVCANPAGQDVLGLIGGLDVLLAHAVGDIGCPGAREWALVGLKFGTDGNTSNQLRLARLARHPSGEGQGRVGPQ